MNKLWRSCWLLVGLVGAGTSAHAALLSQWSLISSDGSMDGTFFIPNDYAYHTQSLVTELQLGTRWSSRGQLSTITAEAFETSPCNAPNGADQGLCTPQKLNGELVDLATQQRLQFLPGVMLLVDRDDNTLGSWGYALERRRPDYVRYALDFGTPDWSGWFEIDLSAPNFANDSIGTPVQRLRVAHGAEVWDIAHPTQLVGRAHETDPCQADFAVRGACPVQSLVGQVQLQGTTNWLSFTSAGSEFWSLLPDQFSNPGDALDGGRLTLSYQETRVAVPEPGTLLLVIPALALALSRRRGARGAGVPSGRVPMPGA